MGRNFGNISMKCVSFICFTILLVSCSVNKTVFVSNKLGKAITLVIDSTYTQPNGIAIKDSLNGRSIEKSLVIDFGKGKWTKTDKVALENIVLHTKVLINNDSTIVPIPFNFKLNLIRLSLEELWLQIKKEKK